jgi:hypothetical protein
LEPLLTQIVGIYVHIRSRAVDDDCYGDDGDRDDGDRDAGDGDDGMAITTTVLVKVITAPVALRQVGWLHHHSHQSIQKLSVCHQSKPSRGKFYSA